MGLCICGPYSHCMPMRVCIPLYTARCCMHTRARQVPALPPLPQVPDLTPLPDLAYLALDRNTALQMPHLAVTRFDSLLALHLDPSQLMAAVAAAPVYGAPLAPPGHTGVASQAQAPSATGSPYAYSNTQQYAAAARYWRVRQLVHLHTGEGGSQGGEPWRVIEVALCPHSQDALSVAEMGIFLPRPLCIDWIKCDLYDWTKYVMYHWTKCDLYHRNVTCTTGLNVSCTTGLNVSCTTGLNVTCTQPFLALGCILHHGDPGRLGRHRAGRKPYLQPGSHGPHLLVDRGQ